MKCPICKRPVADDAPDRPAAYPFCSDRCKLIDLGRWIDGAYVIPGPEVRTPPGQPDDGREPEDED